MQQRGFCTPNATTFWGMDFLDYPLERGESFFPQFKKVLVVSGQYDCGKSIGGSSNNAIRVKLFQKLF